MPEIIAHGPLPEQRWKRSLPEGRIVILGRAAGLWTVPWDDFVSRRHAELLWREGKLEVRQLETAHNPIYLRGAPSGRFELQPGEHFVIGKTTFTLHEETISSPDDANQPALEHSFSAKDLAKVRYKNADQRMQVLGRLPDLISGAGNNTELFVGLANILLAGIPRAHVVALVLCEADSRAVSPVRVLHWDRRRSSEGTFRPSRRLVIDAVRRQRQSVVYMWSGGSLDGSILSSLQTEGSDWAFCTPVRGTACKGWAVYVAGSHSAELETPSAEFRPSDLQDDVKFTELVASILSSIRQIRVLERRHASLAQFFSPSVLNKFAEEDPEIALEPKQCEVSVLFCDLRGFSRESESHSQDLLKLLERVSRALGVMTSHILEEGGVIGDFQGDAAMGFWGWPIEQSDQSRRACQAALGIRAHFEASAKKTDHPLRKFRVGIGVATGTAVAGKIGTTDQAKVGVFGPIVNMASRLEGLSKLLSAPVLLDEATARAARELIPRELGRVRRVALLKPAGMETAVEVSELLPPVSSFPELTDEHLHSYESALDAFIGGDWGLSLEHLHHVPPIDRVKDFLIAFIVQNNRTPPPDWDGVIRITSKS